MKTLRRFLILMMFLGLSASLIAACDSTQKALPPTALPKPTVPSGSLSAEEIFTMAADRMDLLKSYTYSVLIRYDLPEVGSRFSESATGVVDADKGMHENSTLFTYQGGVTETLKLELLFVENTQKVYQRHLSVAAWDLSDKPFGFVGNNIRHMKEQATNLALVGEEKLNGVIDSYHLSFDVPNDYIDWEDFLVTSRTVRTEMWVSKDELLVRSIKHKFSGQDQGLEAPEVIFNIDIFGINLPVSIPSPYR